MMILVASVKYNNTIKSANPKGDKHGNCSAYKH